MANTRYYDHIDDDKDYDWDTAMGGAKIADTLKKKFGAFTKKSSGECKLDI